MLADHLTALNLEHGYDEFENRGEGHAEKGHVRKRVGESSGMEGTVGIHRELVRQARLMNVFYII